jgi:hypothetical protein
MLHHSSNVLGVMVVFNAGSCQGERRAALPPQRGGPDARQLAEGDQVWRAGPFADDLDLAGLFVDVLPVAIIHPLAAQVHN